MLALILLPILSQVQADVKIAEGSSLSYRVPSTYGYKGLENQKKNNYDTFLRSNIDNEANKRNVRRERPMDMMPCRQDAKGNLNTFSRGQPIRVPLRWNNPHDSSCEVNIWVNNMTQVAPVKRPFHCGGGFQDQAFQVTIPQDFPGCESASDSCVMQIYGHSVEPRTYAICLDFVLARNPAPIAAVAKRQYGSTPGLNIPVTTFQKAIHYADSYDTARVDSQYSGYRGQQREFLLPHVMMAAQIQSYLGNGGLEKTGDRNARLRNQMKNLIKQKEKVAEKYNKDQGPCFEQEKYGALNCVRQYQNTYISNTDYNSVFEALRNNRQFGSIQPYQPMTKEL